MFPQGKEANFAHEGLYRIVTAFYYGKCRKLLRGTTEFKDTVPSGAVVLVSTGINVTLHSDYKLCSYL
jgi:hypothetical protein